MEQNPQPRRRWYRFSLRTMLVMTTLACVLSGYLGWVMNWKRQRREFIARPGILAESNWFVLLGGEKRKSAPWPLRIVSVEGVSVMGICGDDYDETEIA